MNYRKTDPDTSKQAAHDIVVDGTQESMQRLTLTFIKANPGLCSNELETKTGFTDGKLRKRMIELERDGHVQRGSKRASTVSGKKCYTWFPTVATA